MPALPRSPARSVRLRRTRRGFRPDHQRSDFLVEFEPAPELRLLHTYFGLQNELAELLGCPVDLVAPSTLRNPYRRTSIERARQVVYSG